MAAEDADAVADIVFRGFRMIMGGLGRALPDAPTDEQRARWRATHEHFLRTDPDGCLVAERDGRPIGMAVAIRRGPLWGLSQLFVHPDHQSAGVGRRLLEGVRASATGAQVELIMASPDPRAIRRYARLGLDLHPAVGAAGVVDRSALPADLPGRLGGITDLELIDDVDTRLRGSSRADDVKVLLDLGCHAHIVEGPGPRGYVVTRDGSPMVLGADDVPTARELLWRCLADAPDEGTVELPCLTRAQSWAIDVALDARLALKPGGPLFLRGREHPPVAWLPSGVFF